jgi:hypothetical protein
MDSVNRQKETDLEWPESPDAMTAAENHQGLLENERVGVLDTKIGQGQTVPVHTHRRPSGMIP